MTRDALIEATGIRVEFDGRHILDSVDCHVDPGEIVTLIGPNGAGKTTLVRVLLGLLKPDTGQVRRRRGLRIGYVPQRLHVEPTLPLTVAGFLRLGAHDDEVRFEQVLSEVGVGGLVDTPVQRVSGGEMQRVMLARALLREPDLLVLDEPAQGVDVGGQRDLYRLIAGLRERRNLGVLIVSHDLHLVMAATDRVLCLHHHVCCSGEPEAVSEHPEYVRLFGRPEPELAVYTHAHDHHHDVHGDVVESDEARHS
ncbi:MAG: zinc ABC transporter ATP-binding protein ZnuC [Halofilum sp. (in: g-proteobacteria)]|nr:zinc ABC transporter ATP-binding protein ZnuC [Halofilum sp. (in: g-proteobacteria)]